MSQCQVLDEAKGNLRHYRSGYEHSNVSSHFLTAFQKRQHSKHNAVILPSFVPTHRAGLQNSGTQVSILVRAPTASPGGGEVVYWLRQRAAIIPATRGDFTYRHVTRLPAQLTDRVANLGTTMLWEPNDKSKSSERYPTNVHKQFLLCLLGPYMFRLPGAIFRGFRQQMATPDENNPHLSETQTNWSSL
jgi:hypothetical protein